MTGYQNPCDKKKKTREFPCTEVSPECSASNYLHPSRSLAFLSSLETNGMDFKYFLTEG